MNEIMESIESMRWVLLGTGVAMWLWFAYVVGPHMWRWWRGRRERKRGIVRHMDRIFLFDPNPKANSPLYTWTPLRTNEWPQLSGNPGEFPDRQYQGDQVSGLRKELLALEGRVGKLEKVSFPIVQVDLKGGRSHMSASRSQFTGGGVGLTVPVTPAPVEAGVRVFVSSKDCAVIEDEHGKVVAMRPAPCVAGVWQTWDAPASWYAHTRPSYYSELPKDSPEYQRIVESWVAWRKGQ